MAEEENTLQREDYNLPAAGTRRRQIRNTLFKIRNGVRKRKEFPNEKGLKEYIESQFTFGMTWDNFTFAWDISPKDIFKVITEDLWEDEGGGYDPVTGLNRPPSFTQQK